MALSDAIRVELLRYCGDDPVVTLTDAGLVPWRARQLVEGRGRQVTAGELFAVGEHVGVLASELVKVAEIAVNRAVSAS